MTTYSNTHIPQRIHTCILYNVT